MRTSVPEMGKYLAQARIKIDKEEHWTQGATARDTEGNECPVDSPDAVKWCAMGAIESCCTHNPDIGYDLENLLRDTVEFDSGYMGTAVGTAEFPSISQFNYFNDEYATHKDIIGIFDKVANRLGVVKGSPEDAWQRIEHAQSMLRDAINRSDPDRYINDEDDLTEFEEPTITVKSWLGIAHDDMKEIKTALDGELLSERHF